VSSLSPSAVIGLRDTLTGEPRATRVRQLATPTWLSTRAEPVVDRRAAPVPLLPRPSHDSINNLEPAPGPEGLVAATFDLDELAFAALRASAAGFLLRSAEPDALVAAVRTIPRGRGLISPEVTRRPITEFASSAPQPLADPRIDALTPREREVLTLVARGLSERRPRARTQRRQDHVANALSQLDLRSSAGAAVCGRRWGATFPPAITAATPLFLVARAVAQ
jgi:hypothetical protein